MRRIKVRRLLLLPPISSLINNFQSSRHLLGYSAIGASAICLSYQCLRPWNAAHADAEMPSASHQHQQQFQRGGSGTLALEYLKSLRQFIDKMGYKRKQQVPASTPINPEAALCRLALDGVEIDEQHFQPKHILLGQFSDQDLTPFEQETARWKQLLLKLFKGAKAPIEGEEEAAILAEQLKEEEEEATTTTTAPLQKALEGLRIVDFLRHYNTQRRMTKLVRQLEVQTEFDPDGVRPALAKDLPRLLMNALDRFRGRDERMTVATLKVLANTVHVSKEGAEMVANSDWLPLLASMLHQPVYDEERVLAHKILVNCLHGLGMEEEALLPHLYELHRPRGGESAKIDIVFVHGLRGSAFHSWRQRKRETLFWPKDWLANDVREPIRLLALDYPTKIRRTLLGTLPENLEARARRFQREFAEAGIGQRPLVFVAHSMGGLLVKQMLIDNPELLERTLGVLFISTPHRGTPIASKYGQRFLSPTEDVLLLKMDSQLNQALADRFAEQSQRIPLIWTVLECRETPVFRERMPMMFVPVESGVFGRGVVYHLDEQHHHMCKPVDRLSPIYGIVLNFVADALEHVKREKKD